MKNGKEATYYSIACETFPRWKYLVDGIILFKCVGAGTLYLITASQAFITVVEPPKDWSTEQWRSLVAFLTTLVIATPLSFPKRARTLKYPNYFALAAMFYICGMIAGVLGYYGSQKTHLVNGEEKEIHHNYTNAVPIMAILGEIPTLVFAFTCHQNVVTVTNELKNRSIKKMLVIIVASVVFGGLFYFLCGYSGFFLLGDSVISKNIVKDIANFKGSVDMNNPFVKSANIMFWLAMSMSFPMQCLPGRASLWMLIFQNKTFERQKTRNLLKLLSFCIAMLCGGIAALVSDLGLMFAIVGSLGSNVMSFILPSAMYLASFHGKRVKDRQSLLSDGNASEIAIVTHQEASNLDSASQIVDEDWMQEDCLINPPMWKCIGACVTLAFGLALLPLGIYLAVS